MQNNLRLSKFVKQEEKGQDVKISLEVPSHLGYK